MQTTIAPMPRLFLDAISPWPDAAQAIFADIRATVLDAANDSPAAPLNETLKWGEPSWLPGRPRTGSTLRVAWKSTRPDQIGLFVNCQTTLAEDIRSVYPDDFTYQKNRALWVPLTGGFPKSAVAHAAVMTLTYHLKK